MYNHEEDTEDIVESYFKKLDTFRVMEKHCDVTIQVKEQSFKCHRLALALRSNYFDVMFSSQFSESSPVVDNIVLQNTDLEPQTFKVLLDYIYTGHFDITKDNIYPLLRASEFFGVPYIEELCTKYIELNLPIESVFEVFAFSLSTNKKTLLSVVCAYIIKNFVKFSANDEFLQLSFEDLHILLTQHWYSSSENNYILVNAVIKWVHYYPEERRPKFKELIEMIELQNMSEEYLKCLLNSCFEASDYTPVLNVPQYSEMKLLRNDRGLHVFVKDCIPEESQMKVYSINRRTRKWYLSTKIQGSSSIRDLKSIGLNNYVYYFDSRYNRGNNETSNKFIVKCKLLDSPDTPSEYQRSLKSPPFILKNFDMCNVQSTFYFTNKKSSSERPVLLAHSPRPMFLTDEEISRGIYSYNLELDEWFPVPDVGMELYDCALAACQGTLYLMGYEQVLKLNTPILLALDHRTSKWQRLPNNAEKHDRNLICCTHKGRIYMSSNESSVDVYNPIAKKWGVTNSPFKDIYSPKLVSYENILWLVGETYESGPPVLTIRTYNSSIESWHPLSADSCGIGKATDYAPYEIFDAAVF